MKKLTFFLFFIVSIAYGQNIETKFKESGFLKDKPSFTLSNEICQKFKKGAKVIAIEYLVDLWWKVEYKGCVGYAPTHFLKMSDELLKMEKDAQKKRIEEERKFELDEIQRKDSIRKKEEAVRIKMDDSINDVLQRAKIKSYQLKIKKDEEKELKEKNDYFDECSYSSNEKDEFTGKLRKSTYYLDLNKYGDSNQDLEIRLFRYGSAKYLRIRSSVDLGCTSPYSTGKSFAKIKLENNDVLTFYHKDDIDCSYFDLLGALTQNDILRLKRSPIATVRLSGTKYYEDYKNVYFKDFFIKKLDCIK